MRSIEMPAARLYDCVDTKCESSNDKRACKGELNEVMNLEPDGAREEGTIASHNRP